MAGNIFRKIDFTGTDWSVSNRDLAERFGTTTEVIAQARHHFGMSLRPLRRYDWSSVDLTRPTREIAEELGCSEDAVKRARKLAGLSREHVKTSSEAWAEIDWDLTNAQIAELTGHGINLVAKMRKVHGRPFSPEVRAERHISRKKLVKSMVVWMTPAYYDQVQAAAKSEKMSMGKFTRCALDAWMARNEKSRPNGETGRQDAAVTPAMQNAADEENLKKSRD